MLAHFIGLLFPPRESELLVRSVGHAGLIRHLEPRIYTLGSCAVTALLRYDVPALRACVVEAKFHANEIAAKVLGDVLASYLREESDETNLYEERAFVLVPIPLSRERLRERGYNQVETIARHAVAELRKNETDTALNITLDARLLVRIRDTLPQTTLDGQARRQNVRGAFGAARTPDSSVTYIILDDVVTTGATIGEAVRALEYAGVRDVWALALAH